jgi:hypothetical protein
MSLSFNVKEVSLMTRRIAGTVIVDGTDDEIFDDETVHRQVTLVTTLDEGLPAQSLEISDVKWGGECRVELDLTAKAQASGVVQIEGKARLYEGVTEDTTDLAEEKIFTFNVPKGGEPAFHNVQVSNSGFGGGDHAEIALAFTNSLVE